MLFPYKADLRLWWNNALFPAVAAPSTLSDIKWTYRKTCYAWLALMFASLCVLLPNLSYPLIEPDETRYAEIAIGMNTSRDWINPMLDGQPYLDKPPLLYWLTAMSFNAFGTHELAARLPSLMSALLTIVATFALGARIVGQRAAWLGALTLALCGGFVLAGRFLILDSLLAFFTTLCLLTGYIAVREQRHCWLWWIVSGIACALGVLTKGPVALVLCAPPLIVSGWLRADQTRTRIQHWAAFVIPMVLGCVPWYIAVIHFNPQFVDHFFWEHNLKRFTQGSNHRQPIWFYLPIVFASMFPASLLLPSALAFLFSGAERKRRLRTKDLGFLFCAGSWILLFFSLASCKLPTYILPAIPLIALVIGVMMDQTVFRCEAAGGVTTHLKPFPKRAAIILAVAGFIVVGVDARLGGLSVLTIPATAICFVAAGIALWQWRRPAASSVQAWAATGCLAVFVLMLASAQLLPTIAVTRSLFVKTKFAAEKYPDSPIVFFGEKPHGIKLQIDRGRVVYFAPEFKNEFVAFVSRSPDLILITADEEIGDTRIAVAKTHELIGSPEHEHLFVAKRIDSNHLRQHLDPTSPGDSPVPAVSVLNTGGKRKR